MSETVATIFVSALEIYAAVGLIFAAVFVSVGVQRLDSEAQGAGIGFRLLILPGVAAFWPMWLRRWTRGTVAPVAENTPHRRSANE